MRRAMQAVLALSVVLLAFSGLLAADGASRGSSLPALIQRLHDHLNGSIALPEIKRDAVNVAYHRFVLFRSGGATFALHILPHPKYGEDGITYTWYSLPGDGNDFFSPKVEVGQGETREVHGSGVVHAGTLRMEWSKGNRDLGWLYWRDALNDVAVYPLQWMRLEDATGQLEQARWVSRTSVKEDDSSKKKKSVLDLNR